MYMSILIDILSIMCLMVYSAFLLVLGYHLACSKLAKPKKIKSTKVNWIDVDWLDD